MSYTDSYAVHRNFLENTQSIIKGVLHFQRTYGVDCLLARGNSGIKIASAVSFAMDIPLAIIRKNESSHSSQRVVADNNFGEHKNFLIIDDFIDSGRTIEAILSEVADDWRIKKSDNTGYRVSCLLYDTWCSDETLELQAKRLSETDAHLFVIRKA